MRAKDLKNREGRNFRYGETVFKFMGIPWKFGGGIPQTSSYIVTVSSHEKIDEKSTSSDSENAVDAVGLVADKRSSVTLRYTERKREREGERTVKEVEAIPYRRDGRRLRDTPINFGRTEYSPGIASTA